MVLKVNMWGCKLDIETLLKQGWMNQVINVVMAHYSNFAQNVPCFSSYLRISHPLFKLQWQFSAHVMYVIYDQHIILQIIGKLKFSITLSGDIIWMVVVHLARVAPTDLSSELLHTK